MTWTAIDWVNGETITEAKLDQIQANADHLRAENVGAVVASFGRIRAASAWNLSNTGTPEGKVELYVGGALLDSWTGTTAGATERVFADVDISGETDSTIVLAEMRVYCRRTSESWPSAKSHKMRFYKTPDLERLSFFFETLLTSYYFGAGSGYTKECHVGGTLVGHLTDMGW